MTRPETLLTFSDYVEDFKARVQIHNFEVKKLGDDISLVLNVLTDRAYYNLTDRWTGTNPLDFLSGGLYIM